MQIKTQTKNRTVLATRVDSHQQPNPTRLHNLTAVTGSYDHFATRFCEPRPTCWANRGVTEQLRVGETFLGRQAGSPLSRSRHIANSPWLTSGGSSGNGYPVFPSLVNIPIPASSALSGKANTSFGLQSEKFVWKRREPLLARWKIKIKKTVGLDRHAVPRTSWSRLPSNAANRCGKSLMQMHL